MAGIGMSPSARCVGVWWRDISGERLVCMNGDETKRDSRPMTIFSPETQGARHERSEVGRCWFDMCFKKSRTKESEMLKDPQLWCFFLGTDAGRRFGESLLGICRLAKGLAPERSRLVDRIAEGMAEMAV
jgi:hypothetical protein